MNQMCSVGAEKLTEKRRPEPANCNKEGNCKIEVRLTKQARLGRNDCWVELFVGLWTSEETTPLPDSAFWVKKLIRQSLAWSLK
jgi:hypothetical protein